MFALRMLLLLLGVYACSTAVIMIKASEVDAVLLAAYRVLVAAVFLSPAFWRAWRRHRATFHARDLRRSILPGLLLGLHFITWIIGARWTLSANASLIVNLVPVAMPFLAFLTMGERVNGGEVVGTVVSLAGAILLGVADFHLSRRTFAGDVLCLVSMLFFALYLALGRRHRDVASVWLYIVPLYAVSGLFSLTVALAMGSVPAPLPPREWLLVLGLGVIPTVIGHSILVHSMRHLRSQLVSICTLGQFVFAGIMAYFLFQEVPGWVFYAACALLVGGAVLAIRATPPAACRT